MFGSTENYGISPSTAYQMLNKPKGKSKSRKKKARSRLELLESEIHELKVRFEKFCGYRRLERDWKKKEARKGNEATKR